MRLVVAIGAAILSLAAPAAAGAVPRAWPDTTRGVHVFNDQLSRAAAGA